MSRTRTRFDRSTATVVLAVGLLALAAGHPLWAMAWPLSAPPSSAAEIVSSWRSGDVTIDGSIADWPALVRVADGPAIAAQNDAASLFLAVGSSDPTVRVQLATGLVVWIDAADRRRQTFGVRLEGLAPRAGGASTQQPSGQLREQLDRFDLLGPARLQRRLIDDPSAIGYEMASGVDGDLMVYELKIPLASSAGSPHAAGAAVGTAIGVGVETPADPRPPRQRNRLANPTSTAPWVQDPWGYGGYFTQPPPPPGGWPREPKEEEFKPLKLQWISVRLASTP
jgi:hypothetical protein